MATFAPSPGQTNDPLYIGWSKPIQQPEADKSGAYQFSAVGDVLETGAKGVDEAIKYGIAQNMNRELQPIVDARTQELKDADAAIRGQQPQTQNLLSNPDSYDIPKPLQKLPDILSNLESTRRNGSKSETHYIGQLYQIAKDYRDRYNTPAYRQYIDHQFEQITGIPSANAQIKSILGDINSFLGQKDNLKNKVVSELTTYAFPGSAGVIQRIEKGENPLIGVQFLEQRKGLENQWKLANAEVDAEAKNREGISFNAEAPVLRHLNGLAIQNIDAMTTSTGVKISDLMTRAGEKGGGLKDEEWQQLGVTATMNMKAVESQMRRALFEQRSDGRTWYEAYGAAKSEEAIKNALSLHRTMIDGITNQHTGLAFGGLHAGQAILADGNKTILGNPDARKFAILLHAAQTFGGPNAWGETFKDAMAGRYAKDLRDSFQKNTLGIIGQVGEDLRPTTKGPAPVTMTSVVTENKDKVKDPAYWDALAHTPAKIILNPKYEDQARINAIRSFATDPNAIFNFSKSDVKDGRKVPGQFEYYSEWTSPKITAEVKRLSDTKDPSLWGTYKTWAERTYTQLYSREIKSLGEHTELGNIGITWHPDTYEFTASTQINPPKYPGQYRPELNDNQMVKMVVQQSLDRLNMGIKSLAEVGRTNGEKDVGGYVLKTFHQMGIDLSKTNDLSGQIIHSIKSQYADDGDATTGSLGSFLKNPGGALGTQRFNASASSSVNPRGNLGEVLGIKVDDIPEGMSARDFIKQLQSQDNKQAVK